MSLYEEWSNLAGEEMPQKEHKNFWDNYYKAETEAYKKILAKKDGFFEDKYSTLAEEFGMSDAIFAGFMDGINTSLVKEYDVKKLKESSDISLKVDLEKLYYNMIDAKAKWLYTLPEWDDLLTEDKRSSIQDKWRKDKQAVSTKIERNAPCPCGSGKKYKKCCGMDK